MKKTILAVLISSFFFLSPVCSFSADKKNQKQDKNYDPPMIMIGNYDDEEEPAKPAEKKQAPETVKEGAKKTDVPAKEPDKKTSAVKKKSGTTEYEFNAFKVNIPSSCDVQMSDDKKASTVGENNPGCPVKGHLGQFDRKIEAKYMIEMYKKRCENNKKKTLYKKWLNNKNMEGYLIVCQGEKDAEVAMETNSVTKDMNYQFLGSVKGDFNQGTKVAIYMMLNSITEKDGNEGAIPAK